MISGIIIGLISLFLGIYCIFYPMNFVRYEVQFSKFYWMKYAFKYKAVTYVLNGLTGIILIVGGIFFLLVSFE